MLLEYKCGIFFLDIFIRSLFVRIGVIVIGCFVLVILFLFCFCGKFVFKWDLINFVLVFVWVLFLRIVCLLGLVFFVKIDIWWRFFLWFDFFVFCCIIIGFCSDLILIFLLVVFVFFFDFLILLGDFGLVCFFIDLLILFLLFLKMLVCVDLVVLIICVRCDMLFEIVFELYFFLLLFDVGWGFKSSKDCCWFWLIFCMLWNGEFFVLFLLIICCIEWIGVVSCVLWWFIIFNKFKSINFCKSYGVMYYESE